MNLPNVLTLSRLLAIPVLLLLLLGRFPGHDQAAAALFLVSSLTDSLDGQLARRRGQVTELGKFLDPLADKLFVLSVLIALVQEGLVASWVVIVIFGRELLITILRSVSAGQGQVIAATRFGKTKTIMQVGAVLLLILQRPYPVLAPWAVLGVGVMVAFTLVSGADYLWSFRHVLLRRPDAVAVVAGGAAEASTPLDPLAKQLIEKLMAAGRTVVFAESCTGGLASALVTDVPGSSQAFVGGVIVYSNEMKTRLLGVSTELLDRHGAVSAEVASAMAEGARGLGADYGVGITGIAGPDSDGTDKPVGLTFVGVSFPGGTRVERFEFKGDRWQNRREAAREALRLVLRELLDPA